MIYDQYILKRLVVVMLMLLVTGPWAIGQQGARVQLRAGNKAYIKQDFKGAEQHYRKALGKDPGSLHALYNLGGALYKQQRFNEAADHYGAIGDREIDSLTRSRILYNHGNALYRQVLEGGSSAGELLSKSIEAYSQALRYNPEDVDARYNLSKALMQRNTVAKNQQKKQQDEQHERDKQKQEQSLPESSRREEQDKQPEAPPHEAGNISREDAERMLNAIREKEMKTAEQINERERQRSTSGKLRDW